ncbi:MAG: hypothetical protein QNM02_16285 [Acidimicrobiia bacterium]|nr:hypothetical protein [Acidimicrobiia bacterium]
MSLQVLDPTYDEDATILALADRPSTLADLTVGIVSNGKHGTQPFFAALDKVLREDHGVAAVVHVTKSNYSAPADAEVMDHAQQWHALIAGVGD